MSTPIVCDPMIPSGGSYGNAYRYFTLPIEQIPGFDATKDQVLCRSANGGLRWVIPECIPVVTCVTISEASGVGSDPPPASGCSCEIKLTRQNVYILRAMNIVDEPCETVASLAFRYTYNPETQQWEGSVPPSQ